MQRAAEMLANCDSCTKPLDPDGPDTYVKIEAWEKKALGVSRRAGRDVVLRERVERDGRPVYCCGHCVRAAKAGTHPLQGELAPEAA